MKANWMQFSSAEDVSFKAVRSAIQSFNALPCSSWPSLCQSMLPHLLDGRWQARKSAPELNMSKSESSAGRAHPSGHTSWILGTLPKRRHSECPRNKSQVVPWVVGSFWVLTNTCFQLLTVSFPVTIWAHFSCVSNDFKRSIWPWFSWKGSSVLVWTSSYKHFLFYSFTGSSTNIFPSAK